VVVAANGTITITPPVGPSDTASRRIYRTDKTNTGEYFYVTGGLIANNTASQTIVDSTADSGLGIPIPSTSQLTVDTAAGATSIAVDANKNFSVGDLIQIGPVISASASTPTYGATYNITLNNESEIRRVEYKDGSTGLALDVPTGFWHGDNTHVQVVTAITDVVNDQYINLVPGVYETVDVPDPDMTIEARYFLGTQSKRNFYNAYKGQQTFTGSVPGFILLDGRALRYPIGKVVSTTKYVNTGASSGAPHNGMLLDGALRKGDTFVTVDVAKLANTAGTVAQNAYLLFTGTTTMPGNTTISNATTEIRQHIGAASATLLQLDYPLQFAHADNEIVLYIMQAEASTTLATASTTVPYTHAITETIDLDTVSWHLHMRDSSETAANDFDRRYYGGMIGGATLSADEGGMLTMSWDGVNFQGIVHNQKLGDAGAVGATVPFYTKMQSITSTGVNFPTNDPYYFSQGEVTIFGQTLARVRNFSLSIANNEEPRYYIQRRHQRHRGPTEIREQRREYSLALTLALPDSGNAEDSTTARLFNELLWEGDYGAGSGTGMVGFNITLSFTRETGDSITITIPDDGTAEKGGNQQGAFIRTAPHAVTGDNPLQVDADVLFRNLKIDVLDNTHYYP
jgi:hypothetical protein